MHATTEVLEDNKVKLTVEVDEEELRDVENDTFHRLTQEVRLPGFRPGKVPRQLLASRLGKKAVRDEVLRDALPRYYSDAVDESELDIITSPEINITAGEEGGPLTFEAVVEVRPKVSIAGYEGLVATLPSPVAKDEDIDSQIDRMRQQFATLTEVDRAARDGDLVTLNIEGTRDGESAEGLTADDLVYEVGTGGIVEGIDAQLFGAKSGDSFEIDVEDAPGGPAHLAVAITLVREKVLPDLDDAFASDASEFDTVAELRSDLTKRITDVKRYQASMALREKALDSLIELIGDEPPVSLVNAEAEQLLQDLLHRLSHQQMNLEAYLDATGQQPEALLAELEGQAVRQVKADLGLRALAEAESIEVDESDVDEELIRLSEQTKQTPAQLRTALEKSGRMAGLRSQIKNAKAVAWLVEHVDIVDDEGKPMDRAALEIEAGSGLAHDHDHDHHDHDHAEV